MQKICRVDELPENQGRGFVVSIAQEVTPILLVRRGHDVYAYRNRCPHRGTTLDWMPDRFMDAQGEYLQCATHDARFEVESGLCVAGPCPGAHLQAVKIRVAEGEVLLEEA